MNAGWTLTSEVDVARFAQASRELFSAQSAGLQFDQTLPWFEAFARHATRPEQQPIFLSWRDPAGTLAGVLPMLRMPASGLLGRRTLRAMSNYYSSLFAPLTAPGVTADNMGAAFAAALVKRLGRWDVLEMEPLAPEGSWLTTLGRELDATGFPAQTYFRFGNWYLEVALRSYDEYFRGLNAQLRNTVSRREKRLRKAGKVDIRIIQGGAELDAALAAYQQVYAASWKKPEPFPEFVPALVRAMAQTGWLRLGVLTLDERPAAAQLWFVKDAVASIFKLAYDERLSEYSPGSLLTTALMRHVIDVDRVARVDYLTGDDRYKRDWMSHRRERHGLMAFNLRTPLGLAAYLRNRAGTVFRRWHARVRPPSPISDATNRAKAG